MTNTIKIIISGLDNAGKTSILTALNYKFDFLEIITSLTPTVRVNYLQSNFLNNSVTFWDMGGQEKYRKEYIHQIDKYFGSTDLLIYVIDIQDSSYFSLSLNYLKEILKYFKDRNLIIPILISFHKYDPSIRSYEKINNNIDYLYRKILKNHSDFNITFQQTSIFDIVSIIYLMSYGLAFFDEKYLDLSLLIQEYSQVFQCHSLILFDENGLIIADFYNELVNSLENINLIKKHIFMIKENDDGEYIQNHTHVFHINKFQSYILRLNIADIDFFLSIFFKKENMINVDNELHNFLKELKPMLNSLLL